jgi:hypothetical protein
LSKSRCVNCGASLGARATVCRRCGVKVSGRTSRPNLLVLGLIAGVVLVLAGVFLALQQNRPPEAAASQPAASAPASEVPFPDVPRIGLTEAKARIDAGQALVLDVRGADDFKVEHIPGALSIPLAELEGRLSELPKNAEIITYCT